MVESASAPLRRWLCWLLVGVLCAVPFWVAFQIRGSLPHDDAFITFTYARNVAQGNGFVYNGGAPRLGTTTPLLTLLLALLKRLLPGAEVYTIANWTGAVLWAAAGLVAYLLGHRIAGSTGGVALAALHVTNGMYPYVLAAEYPLLTFLSFLGIHLAIGRRQGAAGVVLGLAFLTRGDAAILAGLVGLVLLVRDRRVPWGLGIGFVLVVLPWLVYAFAQFEDPLPAALAMKRAHRTLEMWPHLYVGFWRWVTRSGVFLQTWLLGITLLSLIVLGLSIARRNVWGAVLVLWGLLYAVAYLLLDIHFYFWYSVPLLVSLASGAGIGLALLGQPGQAGEPARASQQALSPAVSVTLTGTSLKIAGARGTILSVLLAVAILGLGGYNVWQTTLSLSSIRPRQAAYVAVGRWLAENTPPDSTVAFVEVGLVGYFSHRQIIDLLGLVTPGMEPYLLARDHAGILEAYQPDYYIRNTNYDAWPMNQDVHESAYFQHYYTPIAEIPQDGAGPIVIYASAPK